MNWEEYSIFGIIFMLKLSTVVYKPQLGGELFTIMLCENLNLQSHSQELNLICKTYARAYFTALELRFLRLGPGCGKIRPLQDRCIYRKQSKRFHSLQMYLLFSR